MKLGNLENLVGRKVTIGFGKDNNRIVIIYGKGGVTVYSSSKGLKFEEKENIKILITPREVECKEAKLIKNKMIFLKLGQHRFLSASYIKKNNLHVVYLPDESDLEYGRSQFMNKCYGKGLM